eukprot:7014763-Prorocentrum_lima.AAC.1
MGGVVRTLLVRVAALEVLEAKVEQLAAELARARSRVVGADEGEPLGAGPETEGGGTGVTHADSACPGLSSP